MGIKLDNIDWEDDFFACFWENEGPIVFVCGRAIQVCECQSEQDAEYIAALHNDFSDEMKKNDQTTT